MSVRIPSNVNDISVCARWVGRRARYQCSPSFEPSAAAVMIAGIPIATAASAIARASIMAFPLNRRAPKTSDQELKKTFARSRSSARLLQSYFAASFLVSRLVAIIGPAFRGLRRESGRLFSRRRRSPAYFVRVARMIAEPALVSPLNRGLATNTIHSIGINVGGDRIRATVFEAARA